MRMTSRILISAAFAVSLVSCKPSGPSAAPSNGGVKGKPTIFVANYPLKYFAERIGGDLIEVQFPAPADEDPAFWEPADDVISAFQNADLILMNGATYSKWAEKATLPPSKIVDTSAAFKSAFIEEKVAVTHSHGTGGDHSHSGTAFTTWLDFEQAVAQATVARAGIGRLLPDAGAALDQNLAKLSEDLRALDERMKNVGKRMNNQPLIASHPVYQYWARRYGIHLKSVLWEPESVPTDKQMDDLKAVLASHPAKWMVWEGDPAKESVEKIKALGLQSVVFDPCGNLPESGDFLSVMKANLEAMEKAFP
jgi:zinc transport system substrate-binding protein